MKNNFHEHKLSRIKRKSKIKSVFQVKFISIMQQVDVYFSEKRPNINNLNYIPFKYHRLTHQICEHKLSWIVLFRIFKSTNFREKGQKSQKSWKITKCRTNNDNVNTQRKISDKKILNFLFYTCIIIFKHNFIILYQWRVHLRAKQKWSLRLLIVIISK